MENLRQPVQDSSFQSQNEVIASSDTEWPWPQFPRGAKRNYDRAGNEAFSGWEGDFLDALRNTGVVRSACYQARVSYYVVQSRKRADTDFRSARADAMEMAKEALLAAAWQRAVYGV